MIPLTSLALAIIPGLGAFSHAQRVARHVIAPPPIDTVRRSSDWLSLLPEGEEKRRFILDCTGCHQLDDQIATTWRSPAYGGRVQGKSESDVELRDPLPSRGAIVRHLAIDPRTHDLWIAYGASPGPIPAKIARLQLR